MRIENENEFSSFCGGETTVLKQRLNKFGITGVIFIVISVLLIVFFYYAQREAFIDYLREDTLGTDVDAIKRKLDIMRYGRSFYLKADFTALYLTLGTFNLFGWILLLIGRDYALEKE